MPTQIQDKSFSREIEIPARYHQARELIETAVLPIAIKADELTPGGRFGMRAFNHGVKLADDAAMYGRAEGFTSEQIGVLMLSLLAEDIGRHIAALPYAERATFIPVDKLGAQDESGQSKWQDNNRAQHNHGELSQYFLEQRPELLAALTEEDRRIVIAVAANHHTKELAIERSDPAFRYCQIGRDIDKCDILMRREFMTPSGALEQFKQWGWNATGLSKEETEKLLNNDELKGEIGQYLAVILERNLSVDDQRIAEKYREGSAERKLIEGLMSWFEAVPNREQLLQRIKDWGENPASKPPQLSKDEMISGYPAYMLAHLVMALQVETPSVLKILNEQSVFDDRLNFVRRSVPAQVFEEYLRPAFKKLNG